MRAVFYLRGGTQEMMLAPGSDRSTVQIAVADRFDGHPKPFEITEKHIDEMMANFDKGMRIVGVDIDHKSAAPATHEDSQIFGEVLSLRKKSPTRLDAEILWNPEGAELLRARKFNGVSPEIHFNACDKRTGENIGTLLAMVALTNRPFQEGMDNAGLRLSESGSMAMETINAQAGDPREDSVEETTKSPAEGDVIALREDNEKKDKQILALTEERDNIKSELEQSRGESVKLAERLGEIEGKFAKAEADKAVAAAMTARKITPAQKEWAESYALRDAEGFAAFVEAAPVAWNEKPEGAEEDKASGGDTWAAALSETGCKNPKAPTTDEVTAAYRHIAATNPDALSVIG